jgi:hypothetical protein
MYIYYAHKFLLTVSVIIAHEWKKTDGPNSKTVGVTTFALAVHLIKPLVQIIHFHWRLAVHFKKPTMKRQYFRWWFLKWTIGEQVFQLAVPYANRLWWFKYKNPLFLPISTVSSNHLPLEGGFGGQDFTKYKSRGFGLYFLEEGC